MQQAVRSLAWIVLVVMACRDALAPPLTDGELGATVGAKEFSATTVFVRLEDRELVLSAVDERGGTRRSIAFTLSEVSDVGEYDLAVLGNVGGYAESQADSTQSWICRPGQGTGSVTITELTGTRVAGTFSFSAPALISSGAVGTKMISSGWFDVKPYRQ